MSFEIPKEFLSNSAFKVGADNKIIWSKVSILRPSITLAARHFVGHDREFSGGQLFAAMDHSHSEQLGNGVHTTVVILSRALQHSEAARAIAAALGREELCEWKNATKRYKTGFRDCCFNILKQYHLMFAVAHVTDQFIALNEDDILNTIRAKGSYVRTKVDGKQKISLGPFIDVEAGETVEPFYIAGNQGPVAAFTTWFLLVLHSELQNSYDEIGLYPPTLFRMQIWADKPPNNFDGPYGRALAIFLNAGPCSHRFTYGGFTGSEPVDINLLADNLAGLFREFREKNQITDQSLMVGPPRLGVGCVQYYISQTELDVFLSRLPTAYPKPI